MILRELLTKLGFDVDTKGLDQFERSIKSASVSLLAIGGVITGAATALFGLVKNVGSVASEIKDSSRELGLSTDALQEWRYAADQAGISNETLANGISIFSRNVGAAATNATGPFVDRLAQMGIRLTDTAGQLKDNDTLLLEVADSLSSVKDAQLKGIMAQELFGKSGLRMASWLSSGSKEVQELRNKAKELGLVLGSGPLDAAASFESTLKNVFSVVKALKNEVGIALMPVVKELAEAFLLWVKINRQLLKQKMVSFFKSVLKYAGYLGKAIELLAKGFDWLVKQTGSAENALLTLIGVILAVRLAPLIYFLGLATIAMWRFFAGLVAVNGGVLLIPIAMAIIATAIWMAVQEILGFFGFIKEADKLTPFEALKASIIAVVAGLLIVRAINLIQWAYGLVKAAAVATGAAWTLAGGIAGFAKAAWAGVAATWALVAPWAVLIGLAAVLVYAVYKLGEAFNEALGDFTFIDKFKAAWEYLKAWLGLFFTNLGNWLGDKFNKLIDGFVEKIMWLKNKLVELNPFGDDKPELDSQGRPIPKTERGVLDGKPLSFSDEGNKPTRLGTVKNFFQNVAGESQMLAAAPVVVPQQIMRAGNNTSSTVTNNRPVNVTSNVNVTMPPGVSSANEADVTAAVRAAWQEDLQKMLETAHYNNAELE